MSVSPLPAYRIFHLHTDVSRVRFSSELPTLAELGRFHFAKDELRDLRNKEKDNNNMAFKAIDLSSIPVNVKGRASATEPKIGISASGQIMPNSFVGKAWEGVDRVAILFDDESRKLGLMGLKPDSKLPKGVTEASCLKLSKGKDGKGSGSIAASGMLRTIMEYDYAASQNQAFDTVWNEKLQAFIITVPKGSLTPKPTTPRKPKAATSTAVAGAIVNKAIETVLDTELLLEQ